MILLPPLPAGRLAITGAALVSTSLILAACTQAQRPSVPNNPDVTSQQAEVSDEQAVVVLELSNFEFSQPEIRVKRGQAVTVKVDSTQNVHDFVIDELDVRSERIFAGQTDSVTFTIPEDFEQDEVFFYCSVGNHRHLGMEGKLIIEG
ncbi:MAG: hypothetical protein COU69_00210 [Candidatus Pacebacteria bacterium CG10_big_fil_rev_8_21_14_0_10_56_10]|nr:MAG: hypothetical protein COU69_00210 [Candidatus Pacebacteria bacterium CG10_big_fil_rev_8_21_14_0_10_56_10]